MDLAKGIIDSLSISLGDMEEAVDFFDNYETFEPELSEVKETVYNKDAIKVEEIDSKNSEESLDSIISKFSLKEADGEANEEACSIIMQSEDIHRVEEEKKRIEEENIRIQEENKRLLVELERKRAEAVRQKDEIKKLSEEASKIEEESSRKIKEAESKNEAIRKEYENRLKSSDTIKKTSIGKEKKKSINNQVSINNVERELKNINICDKSKYDKMSTEALYKEVKIFLIKSGVQQHMVEKDKVDSVFGRGNTGRLIREGYLINIGNGISIGIM